MARLTRGRLPPRQIAALYLAITLAALLVSDLLLPLVLAEPLLHRVQAIKGLVEIVLTAALLYLLLRWYRQDRRLQERAMDAASVGITISDPDQADNPLVYANERFTELTGYEEEEVRGRNCRFLQGEETDPEAVAELRTAIREERPVTVDIINYSKNGAKFWNRVAVAPVHDDDGTVTNFVGFQADITERKVREERVRVLNRVLRHNFRNKLTVIAGQLELLGDDLDDPPPSIATIQEAARELESLTETVRVHESVLDAEVTWPDHLAVDEQLVVLVDAFRDRYPAARLSLSVPDEPPAPASPGMIRAAEEAIENAIKHNESDSPRVEATLVVDEGGWLRITIDDDGPGIPSEEIDVLSEGERPLKHAHRIGLWSIHWIVSLAGGSMEVVPSPLGGTRVIVQVPSERA